MMLTEQNTIPQGWKERTLGEVLKVDESTIDNSYPFDEIEYVDIASVEDRKILQTQKLKLQDAPAGLKELSGITTF